MTTKPTVTLGQLHRDGWHIYANCGGVNCSRGRPMDIEKMIADFGEDYTIMGDDTIARLMRCNVCGHKGGRFIFTSPNRAA